MASRKVIPIASERKSSGIAILTLPLFFLGATQR
ncbi:Uncharacterised protein [Mycobacterium tuberculosis]|nr:Uncharacterised protein [Mycobacterium tuberculosis]